MKTNDKWVGRVFFPCDLKSLPSDVMNALVWVTARHGVVATADLVVELRAGAEIPIYASMRVAVGGYGVVAWPTMQRFSSPFVVFCREGFEQTEFPIKEA